MPPESQSKSLLSIPVCTTVKHRSRPGPQAAACSDVLCTQLCAPTWCKANRAMSSAVRIGPSSPATTRRHTHTHTLRQLGRACAVERCVCSCLAFLMFVSAQRKPRSLILVEANRWASLTSHRVHISKHYCNTLNCIGFLLLCVAGMVVSVERARVSFVSVGMAPIHDG